jgi:hypothetical protein
MRKIIVFKAVAVVMLFVMATSATSAPADVLGSVSAVGEVEVRGLRISQDATIFSGDEVRVGEKGYAKVLLANGRKLELSGNTDIHVSSQDYRVQVQMTSGTLGFATLEAVPVIINIGSFEIAASGLAAGNVAVLGADSLGVRVLKSGVVLRNTRTKESWVIPAGQERLMSLNTPNPAPPLPQISTNIPPQVPTVPNPPAQPAPPTSQPPQTPGGSGTSGFPTWAKIGAMWGAMVGVFFAMPEAKSSSGPGTNMDGQTLQTAITAAQEARSVAIQVTEVANQLSAAITAATNLPNTSRIALDSQVQQLVSQANASSQRISSLLTQLQQLQSQLMATTSQPQVIRAQIDVQGQINATVTLLNAEITSLNQTIVQLNSLVTSAQDAGVPNVPKVALQTVSTVAPASQSRP